MRRRISLVLGTVALTGATVLVGNAAATPSVGLATKILAKSTFGSTRLSGVAHQDDSRRSPRADDDWRVFLKTHGLTDAYVVDNVVDTGGTTGWHTHPGPSIVFVVRGTITNYDSDAKGCAGHDYAAGSSFTDAGGSDVHMLKNNGTVQAETIAVQFLPTGEARKTDAAAPTGCPAS